MIVEFWKDVGPGWRSRWIAWGASGPAHHTTLTIGDKMLHTDARGCRWVPRKWMLAHYEGVYKPLKSHQLPDYGLTRDQTMTPYPSLNVVWWKYLGGPKPIVCTGVVAKAMRDNGVDAPIYVDPNHLMEWLNDRSRT